MNPITAKIPASTNALPGLWASVPIRPPTTAPHAASTTFVARNSVGENVRAIPAATSLRPDALLGRPWIELHRHSRETLAVAGGQLLEDRIRSAS